MAQSIFLASLRNNSRGVSSSNDDNRAILRRLDVSLEQRSRAACECRELENTWRTVPEDGLCAEDGVLEEFARLGTAVEAHPGVGDAGGVGRGGGLGVFVEVIGGDIVNGENELDVVLLRFLDKCGDLLRTSFIEE